MTCIDIYTRAHRAWHRACVCTYMSVFATPALDDWPGELEVGELGRWGAGKGWVKGWACGGARVRTGRRPWAAMLPSSWQEEGSAAERGKGPRTGLCCGDAPPFRSLGRGCGCSTGLGTSPTEEEPCTHPLWISLWAPHSRSWLRVSRRPPGFLLLPERQMFSRNKLALQASCGISRSWCLEEQYHVGAKSVHF